MIEKYIIKPQNCDRIHRTWLGNAICCYVEYLDKQNYSSSTIKRKISVLVELSEYTKSKEVKSQVELPSYENAFISHMLMRHQNNHPNRNHHERTKFYTSIVRHFLVFTLDNYKKNKRCLDFPMKEYAPKFLDYLKQERGLSPETIKLYAHNLRKFEGYIIRINLDDLNSLNPKVLSDFVVDCRQWLGKGGMKSMVSNLRTFLRYLNREDIIQQDLSVALDTPVSYRLAEIPRSMPWTDVKVLLDSLDRRTPVGKRDYAIILLLTTYGLRASEVAAMKLGDIDWDRARFQVPDRKAGHFTGYPLSSTVAEAIIDYLKNARIQTTERNLFLCTTPPFRAVYHAIVSGMVTRRIKACGIKVDKAGSHTLRHTCVQRLIDEKFDLKTIGDYVGHASYASTQIYSKMDIESLRDIAMGDGESLL